MGSKFIEGVMCGVVAGLVLQWLSPPQRIQVLPADSKPAKPNDLRVVINEAKIKPNKPANA
jgi:hypothetical protein